MKIAYADCFSGISGDMFLGALLDSGVPLGYFQEQIDAMHLPEKVEITACEVMKGAVRAVQATVRCEEGHHHRTMADIARMLDQSQLKEEDHQLALGFFRMVAEAEGKVHGVAADKVHFHEVGALDSIADLVCAAAGLNYLGIRRLYASPLPFGSGRVQTQHGLLPLPAPATLEILAAARAPVHAVESDQELVTPTGAAILAGAATFERPDMVLDRIGTGAGGRDMAWPNVMRLWVGEAVEEKTRFLRMIETNLDNMNPELVGSLMDQLLSLGARDVFFTPIQMKKNRPAVMLSVLCDPAKEADLIGYIFRNSTTLGLRVVPLTRFEAGREMRSVETPFGAVPVKLKILDGTVLQATPEYEACRKLASGSGVSVLDVYQAALSAGVALVHELADHASAEKRAGIEPLMVESEGEHGHSHSHDDNHGHHSHSHDHPHDHDHNHQH